MPSERYVTEPELIDYLSTHGGQGRGSAWMQADMLCTYVTAKRKPTAIVKVNVTLDHRYEAGEVYEDATGGKFYRLSGPDTVTGYVWRSCVTGKACTETTIVAPVRRLS